MIKTKRLILRERLDSDLEPFAEIDACRHVCEFLPGTLSRKESDSLVEKIICKFGENGYGFYAIELRDSGQFIGFTGLNIQGFHEKFMPAVEIGWRLGYKHWGKG